MRLFKTIPEFVKSEYFVGNPAIYDSETGVGDTDLKGKDLYYGYPSEQYVRIRALKPGIYEATIIFGGRFCHGTFFALGPDVNPIFLGAPEDELRPTSWVFFGEKGLRVLSPEETMEAVVELQRKVEEVLVNASE